MIFCINVLTPIVKDRIRTQREADMLSIFSRGGWTLVLIMSPNSHLSHTARHTALAPTMYSASHEESATTLCFWDC